ncbi:MAG: ABC transporter permease, partial [Candidatus Aureabacteria bacterium]|nr:ABC transporter permease [Candidatus Auribacterota bacterium]
MKIRPLLKVSLMSLKYHAFRTFLSALGIVFGVIAVVMMLSVGTGIKQETLAQLEQLGSRHIIMRSVPAEISSQSNQTQIQPSGRPSIKECALVIHHSPDILRWAPLLEMIAPPSVKKQLNDCEIMATSPKYQLIKNLTVKEGRFLCAEDDLKRSRVCVLGWEASRELGEKGKLGGYLRIQNQIFKIVGVLNHLAWSKTTVPALTGRNLNRVIFIPWKTATSFLQGGPGGQNSMEIVLEVKKGVSVIKTGRSLEKIMKHMLKDKSMGVLIPQELLQQMKKTQRNFNLFLGCIACISLLVGGIGIMNIMLV